MIIGTDRLLELISTNGLIEGLDAKDLNIEGCGVDLRVGEIYEMTSGKGHLHRKTRKMPDYKLLARFKEDKSIKIKLKPGQVYVATTIEKINTPKNLFGIFIPRGTFYVAGILVLGLRVDPGYRGKFRFHLINLTDRPFELEMGARIANMIFLQVKGKTCPYRGQWQNGRAFIRERKTAKAVP